jgi:hypothetical protein
MNDEHSRAKLLNVFAGSSAASGESGPVVRLLRERHDELVAQALVIVFVMIMIRELTDRSSEPTIPRRR